MSVLVSFAYRGDPLPVCLTCAEVPRIGDHVSIDSVKVHTVTSVKWSMSYLHDEMRPWVFLDGERP